MSGIRVGYESMLTGARQTGVGVAISELLVALAEAAPEVEFVAFTQPHATGYLPTLGNVIPVVSSFAGLHRGARIVWQQTRSGRAARRHGVDVYHGPGYIVAPGITVPTVVTVYDTIALERPSLTSRSNAAYYRWALPRGVRSARLVVVPSEYVRDRLMASLGVPAARIRVVPLGVGQCFRPLPREEVEGALGEFRRFVPEGRPFFLCVGNVERKKNLGVLIDALFRLGAGPQGPALVMTGRAGAEYSRLREAVRQSNLGDRVYFTGYVTRDVLVSLYNAATAVLYPSLEEGFGLPPLEAMACGTPAVSSNAGSLPEVAGEAGVLLPPEEAAEWAKVMRRLLESPGWRGELRERGFAWARRFRWDVSAQRMLAVYREALER